jgi:hypothetical protein
MILKLGYEVRRIELPEWKNAGACWESAYLKRLGFQPRTVVDAGVASGPPPIYEAFAEEPQGQDIVERDLSGWLKMPMVPTVNNNQSEL